MKILFCFTLNKSFLSNFFFEISKTMRSSNFDVTIFSLKNSEEEKIIDGVPVIISKKGGYVKNYWSVYKTIKKVKPDIVISNFNYVYPALILGKHFGVKKNIAWFHTESSHTKPGFLNIVLKRKITKWADKVIVNSHRLGEDLIKVFKVSEDKIIKVPFWSAINKIDSFDSKKSDSFKIGCPGRLVNGKNHKILFDSVSILKKKTNKEIKLFIAGSGPEEKALKGYVINTNLQNEVEFLGNLSIDEITKFYNNMDLIVLPSLFEAFGLVFLEAISLGIPVLVSNRFGALDYLEKTDELKSIMFDPNETNELSGLMLNYINGMGLGSEYFQTLYSNNFSKEKTWQSLKNALE